MSKRVFIGLGGLAALTAAWLGASVYGASKTQSMLEAYKTQSSRSGHGVRIVELNHRNHGLTSSGWAELAYEPACAGSGDDDDPVRIRVDYEMSHLITPASLMRVTWQAKPSEETASQIKAALGRLPSFNGQGMMKWAGGLHTSLSMPEISVRRHGETLQINASDGAVSVDGKALSLHWKTARVAARSSTNAMEAKDLAFKIDLEDRDLGTGETSIEVGQLSTTDLTVKGASLLTKASERDGRLDIQITPSIDRIKSGAVDVHNLVFAMAVKGLNTRSVRTLTKFAQESCGVHALTADETAHIGRAGMELIASGLTVGIEKISARNDKGSVSGELWLELQESRTGRPSLVEQLKSRGSLTLNGDLLDASQRQMLKGTGFVVEKGNELVAAFEVSAQSFSVNGNKRDAQFINAGLQVADRELSHRIADWQKPAVIAASPSIGTDSKSPVPAPAADAQPGAITASSAQAALAAAKAAEALTAHSSAAATDVDPKTTPAAERDVGVVRGGGASSAAEAAATTQPSTASSNDSVCDVIHECARASLTAGHRQDIAEVRKIASRIDAMGKPDKGNRAVARNLNKAALEELASGSAASAVTLLRKAVAEDPRDVELAGNLGFALLKAGQPKDAIVVLHEALLLDPRRTSTWIPLGEAYAMVDQHKDAKAAIWLALQWSANRDKSLAFFRDRAVNDPRDKVKEVYAIMVEIAEKQVVSLN